MEPLTLITGGSNAYATRFAFAGGTFASAMTPNLERLRDENPEEFDRLWAEARARLAPPEPEPAPLQQDLGRRKERLKMLGGCLTDEMAHACLTANVKPTEAVKVLREWWDNRRHPVLVLSGGTGSGKTVSAAMLFLERGGVWVRCDDLVRMFTGFFGDSVELQRQTKSAPLLVLEDVGAEKHPDHMQSALLEVLDDRASAKGTPTIITTNDPKRQFAERYPNGRLHSRLMERAHWVTLTTADMRRRS